VRIDWFVPFLRKQKKNEVPLRPRWGMRLARRLLPASFFADRVTGKPGRIRRVLKRLGPSVLSSPIRRAVQAICFAIFLWLFFYVGWPYPAQPDPAARESTGWKLAEFAQQSGALTFAGESRSNWLLKHAPVYIEPANSATDAAVAPTYIVGEIQQFERGVIDIQPTQEIAPEQLDALLTDAGTWRLYDRPPHAWPAHYARDLNDKEFIPAESFLVIDPLVSLSTAIAARSWVWSLSCAALILLVCIVIPRGFCGYLCPLGTLIDLFDCSIGQRVRRFRVPSDGWWVHIKYYLLLAVLISSLGGVLISGYVAAIPVITRGLLFFAEPLQTGMLRGAHLIVPLHAGHFVSLLLFAAVLCLGFLQPRFWCKYVCPSGALFSLGNVFRVTERKVESTCINCNKCVEICPFDAIKPDFTTRVSDCTLCQTCGGVCPTHAIKFVDRWNLVELKIAGDPPTGETALGRRGFLSLAAGTAAAITGGLAITATARAFQRSHLNAEPLVRPPGSVPEDAFLDLCIRCGECFKVCPNNVLQAQGFAQGLEGLWSPYVNADWAGCESSCNACGQVCPTGAIRALTLEEKKEAHIGLADVNTKTCLPYADREACQLCVDECHAAGYHAIEFTQVHTRVDEQGQPIAGTGYVAPVVLKDRCVGCGLCQTRCYGINVSEKRLLQQSAIIIHAGAGKEDRIFTGSYIELHRRPVVTTPARPDVITPSPIDASTPVPPSQSDDPFGLN
jgi:ferredoxin